MSVSCVNLLALFGDRYRIAWDPAADSRCSDPWLQLIPCRWGVIFPHGGNKLAVEVDNHNRYAKQLAALPGLRVWQDGTTEKTYVFDVSHFEAAAAIVQPRKRRSLSPGHNARLQGYPTAAPEACGRPPPSQSAPRRIGT
jgi:hypothetical protein